MNALYAQEPQPVGRYSGPFLAEVEKHAGQRLFTVAELTAPWGTERWSNRPISHPTLGNYLGRVLSFGPVAMDTSERTNVLAARETELELADTDFRFGKLLPRYQNRLRLSPVVLRIGAMGIPESGWYTYFTGVLDSWEMVQAQDWRLVLRTNDRPLRSDFPKTKVTLADYPNADVATAVGQFCQIVYGIHNSNGLGGGTTGMIKALYVDTISFVYELSLGWLQEVTNVYADGILIPSSGYFVLHPNIGGRRRTVVAFVATQSGKTITADVKGLTDRGDGTGTLLQKPGAVLQHWLTNFLFGDWLTGDWLAPSVNIDTPSVYETDQFLARKGHEVSKVFGGDESVTTGTAAIEEWCDSHEVKAYWTEAGKLAFRPLHHDFSSYALPSRPWFRGPGQDLGGFGLPQNTRQIANKVSVAYLFGQAAGQFFQTVDVEDLGVLENSIITRDLPYSAARLV